MLPADSLVRASERETLTRVRGGGQGGSTGTYQENLPQRPRNTFFMFGSETGTKPDDGDDGCPSGRRDPVAVRCAPTEPRSHQPVGTPPPTGSRRPHMGRDDCSLGRRGPSPLWTRPRTAHPLPASLQAERASPSGPAGAACAAASSAARRSLSAASISTSVAGARPSALRCAHHSSRGWFLNWTQRT